MHEWQKFRFADERRKLEFMSVKDLSAYELVKEEELKGIKSRGMLLKHKKSGARILLIENDDTNKVFNIGFRRQTVPEYHISWNIPCCVDPEIFRQKIHL